MNPKEILAEKVKELKVITDQSDLVSAIFNLIYDYVEWERLKILKDLIEEDIFAKIDDPKHIAHLTETVVRGLLMKHRWTGFEEMYRIGFIDQIDAGELRALTKYLPKGGIRAFVDHEKAVLTVLAGRRALSSNHTGVGACYQIDIQRTKYTFLDGLSKKDFNPNPERFDSKSFVLMAQNPPLLLAALDVLEQGRPDGFFTSFIKKGLHGSMLTRQHDLTSNGLRAKVEDIADDFIKANSTSEENFEKRRAKFRRQIKPILAHPS